VLFTAEAADQHAGGFPRESGFHIFKTEGVGTRTPKSLPDPGIRNPFVSRPVLALSQDEETRADNQLEARPMCPAMPGSQGLVALHEALRLHALPHGAGRRLRIHEVKSMAIAIIDASEGAGHA
jgi:hypothetical protein